MDRRQQIDGELNRIATMRHKLEEERRGLPPDLPDLDLEVPKPMPKPDRGPFNPPPKVDFDSPPPKVDFDSPPTKIKKRKAGKKK